MVKHFAYVPTIGESPYFPGLLRALEDSPVERIWVTQNRFFERYSRVACLCRLIRPAYRCLSKYDDTVGLYAGWNEAIRRAVLYDLDDAILHVFNDDVVLGPEVVAHMAQAMEDDPTIRLGGYGLNAQDGPKSVSDKRARDVKGTYREGGINGFAWALRLNASERWWTPQVDESFEWWGGDDDLIYQLVERNERCVLFPYLWVRHPQPGLSGLAVPETAEMVQRDRVRLLEKYSRAW